MAYELGEEWELFGCGGILGDFDVREADVAEVCFYLVLGEGWAP